VTLIYGGDNFRSPNVFKEQMNWLALTQIIKVLNMLGVFVDVLSFRETVGIIIEVRPQKPAHVFFPAVTNITK
jgi:hypothetical protein